LHASRHLAAAVREKHAIRRNSDGRGLKGQWYSAAQDRKKKKKRSLLDLARGLRRSLGTVDPCGLAIVKKKGEGGRLCCVRGGRGECGLGTEAQEVPVNQKGFLKTLREH